MAMETKEEAQALIGTVLDGKYRIEAVIGRGGFGVVYRALHLIWEQPVAIKVLTKLTKVGEDKREEVLGFFIREGRLLSALSSRTTGIVQARDIGTLTTAEGLWMPYMVLEWLDGRPLGRILKHERSLGGGTRSVEEVFHLFDGLARALSVAHVHAVAHRDIKPPNIIVLGQTLTPGVVIKLLDFGIAKVMQTHSREALAQTGSKESIFTPYYGAPEQFNRSLGASGPWTDVFAMALVLLEVVIGRRVFTGGSFGTLAIECLQADPRPTPRTLGVEVSDAVEAVFARALAIEVGERYQSMGDFWLALVDALGIGNYVPLPLDPIGDVGSISGGGDRAASSSLELASEGLSGLRARDLEAHKLSISYTAPELVDAPAPSRGRRGLLGVVLVCMIVGGGILGVVLMLGGGGDAASPSGAAQGRAQAQLDAPMLVAKPVEPASACPEGMVEFKGSPYFMGSDVEDVPALSLARPAHRVEVGDFCLDRTEVTVAAYRACSSIGECKRAFADSSWPQGSAEEEVWTKQREAYSPLCNGVDPAFDQHPVNCVTWAQADEYCRGRGGRLPTEVEWEFAARGRDGRVFPWGDAPPTPERVNGCGLECNAWRVAAGLDETPLLYEADDGYSGTAPVGSFPGGATQAGLVDIIGNVFEWTADEFRPYSDEGAHDPKRRVIRGGAFNSFQPEHANPALRYPMAADAHTHGIGFRCAAAVLDDEAAGDRAASE